MSDPVSLDRTSARLRREQLAMRAMQMIQGDLSRELSVERLAGELGVSCSTLAHAFPAVVGETLWQCAKRLRLERAAYNLLSRPATPVLEVALASGFESQAAFSRAFKLAFGCSPTRFRRMPDAHPILSAPNGVHINAAGELTPWTPAPQVNEPLNVRIERRQPLSLAFVRGLGEYEFNHFAAVLQKMFVAAARHNLLGPRARFFSVMYEDPHLAAGGQICYDACVSVSDDFSPVGPFGKLTLPAGTWACLDCEGPPERHFASWEDFVIRWQVDSPWTMSHPMTVNEFHCPHELLTNPVELIETLKRSHSATKAISVKPWPSGSLLPL